jgi:hypothetical protein
VTSHGLAELRRHVLSTPALQEELLAGPRAGFPAAVADAARRLGLEVEPAEVEAEVAAARRAWLERWV